MFRSCAEQLQLLKLTDKRRNPSGRLNLFKARTMGNQGRSFSYPIISVQGVGMKLKTGFKRRDLLVLAGLPLLASAAAAAPATDGARLYQELAAQVTPVAGYQSKVALAVSIVKLTQAGVIDRNKIEALSTKGGGASDELKILLDQPSRQPIRLTPQNARLYVNLLWPLGLANQMDSNSSSPVNGPSLMNFASTGGWTLGREANGGTYFNKFPIVELTPSQEAMVTRMAQGIFRPCCNNSTFFQDCNHGSALLGLLTLGASQGLGEAELYREVLAFNSFWFPEHYTHIALYFKVVKGLDWPTVDARTALGTIYSSACGMQTIVLSELQKRGLMTRPEGTNCSA